MSTDKTKFSATKIAVSALLLICLIAGGPLLAIDPPPGPAPTVQATADPSVMPVASDGYEEPSLQPNHPPFDEIPPMPMCTGELVGLDIFEDVDTIYVHDAATGETIELPAGVLANSQGDSGGGYHGSDGDTGMGQGEIEINGDVGALGFTNMTEISDAARATHPWRMNCKLVMRFVDLANNDRWFNCSGSMIDAETVLTAAHCVYARTTDTTDIFDWAEEIWVYPGWDGAHSSWSPPPTTVNPYGYGRGTWYMAGSAYVDDGNTDRDCGLVRITRAAGMLTGWFGWTWGYGCSWIQDRTYHNASYPGECCIAGCGLHTARDMYYWYGGVDSCPSNQMQINTTGGCFNAGWGGMSGSAMYWIESDFRRAHSVSSTSNRSTRAYYCKLWEQFVLDMNNDFIPDARGSSFDIQPLDVNAGPTTIAAGSSTTLLNHLAANPTNGSANGTWNFDVYLSTNDNISTSDTYLGNQFYSHNFGAMSSVRVNMVQVTIPPYMLPDDYWVGVIYDPATDINSGNNDTDGWDAAPITVYCPSQGVPTNVTASDTLTEKIRVSWWLPSGAVRYDVYRGTSSSVGSATKIADNVTISYYDDTTAATSTTYYYWVRAQNACGNESAYSSYDTGYRPIADSCLNPPSYNYTIVPKIDWSTASGSFGFDGCRVYRMYLYADLGYDFTICAGDGVGGAYSGGDDGDFRMYNSSGSQLWYIHYSTSCPGEDATTLNGSYEDWSPPSDGYYYLKVIDHSTLSASYTLAYKMNGEHCHTPPSYDELLTPAPYWQTTDTTWFAPSGCRIYKMFLQANKGYDFSLCVNDAAGGWWTEEAGDGDLTMYASDGDSMWFIDGSSSCGWDASTIPTSYQEWSPPGDGMYYLKVSEWGNNNAGEYQLAYKSCPKLATPSQPTPQDGDTGISTYTDLSWGQGTPCKILDDFNRKNGTNMGPDWVEHNGDFSIVSNMATSTNQSLMTYVGSGLGSHFCIDAIENGTGGLQYVALVLGYADLNNCVFIKLQASGGQFTNYAFYFGNNASNNGAWDGTGFYPLSVPFTEARMTAHLIGDMAVLEVDSNFDGLPDQTYASDGVPTQLLGSGSGLGGYGNPLMDNFGVAANNPYGGDTAMAMGGQAAQEPDRSLEPDAVQPQPITEVEIQSVLQRLPAQQYCGDADATINDYTPAIEIPVGYVLQGGMFVESDKAVEPTAGGETVPVVQMSAGAYVEIGFDDVTAPCLFSQTTRLTNRYASLGVIFEGPGGNDGGAIVNECGGWGVSGQSSPNFLGFNPGASLMDPPGGTPQGPETLYFNPPVSSLSCLVGSGAGDVTIDAYNAGGTLLDSTTLTTSATMTPIGVYASGITRAVISHTSWFVLDDLRFTPQTTDCLDLGHPTEPPSIFGGIGRERSVAVDMNEAITVTSLDVMVLISEPTELTVTIREVTGTTRGAILAAATVPIGQGGAAWYSVPIDFTFEASLRYDIGFNVTGNWSNTDEMEWYWFDNPTLNPADGFDVGPFKVLDGGEWGGSGYPNSLLPHIRACTCSTVYDVYFGTSPRSMSLTCENVPIPFCEPMSSLDSCQRYYWQVIAKNCCDARYGPTWSFVTKLLADINNSNKVDLPDYALLVNRWMEPGCGDPDWCQGADLDHSNSVGWNDLVILAGQWLESCSE